MNLYRIVNIVYRTLWLILIILIFTFDRSSNNSVYILGLLVILTIVAVVRAINSRNEWRPIAEKHYFENMTEETSKDD
ncbi:MAG TPA: hypothetical protein EYO50_09755 [Candidatus Marinimicrobia bacterium]|jgi:hypothetical protein|nr:hypothetical protein [Candidatus Neomarinimicrobiota bacterium]HIM27021.1 hypothetical protein [Candidatus Neomarinimicrobiota bacterium]